MRCHALLVITIFIAAVGCAPKLSATGASIMVAKTAGDVAGCAKLGKVEAGTYATKTGDDPQAMARNDLKNKAADMGGTHIMIDEGPMNLGKAHDAEVYKCEKAGASAPASSGTPASSAP